MPMRLSLGGGTFFTDIALRDSRVVLSKTTWTPLELSETPRRVRRLAPMPGEHHEEVFAELLGHANDDLAGSQVEVIWAGVPRGLADEAVECGDHVRGRALAPELAPDLPH